MTRAGRSGGSVLATGLAVLVACLALPALAVAAPGIGGTVSGPGPIDEVEVCVVEAKPSETCVFPEASGRYEMQLGQGIYRVEFLPSYRSHLVTQYYNHKPKLSEANRVVVSGENLTLGIDADLELGGEIEGRATDALSALGLEEVEVCAQDATTGAAVSCSHTDADGDYALPSVPPGSYRVGFWGERRSAAYAPQYYDERPSFFEGTVIPVGAGATVTGINAELHLGARVSGRVSDSVSGSPLSAIAVCILKSGVAAPERCAYTDEAGEYALPGVSSGSYQVVFSPEFNEFSSEEFVLPEEDGWHTQYYAGSPTRAGGTTLTLAAPQQRTGVDAVLLTTVVPPPPAIPPPAPSTAIPLPPIANQPPAQKKANKCRKGYRKRKVKGKVRCVKARRSHPGRKKSARSRVGAERAPRSDIFPGR